MKNLSKRIISIGAVAAAMFAFVGCSSGSAFILPEFVFNGDGFKIVHLTNMESDYVFCESEINDASLKHDDYLQWNSIDWAWAIRNGDGEDIGWITTDGGYYVNNKNKSDYSYGFPLDDAKHFSGTSHISIYLFDANAEDITSHLRLTVNYGSVTLGLVDDTSIPDVGVASYTFDPEGANPQDSPALTFTISVV